MAGLGSRFLDAGYKLPKPFIDVNGRMMIERVLDNLKYQNGRLILIAQNQHMQKYSKFFDILRKRYDVEILGIDNPTDGAACTCLRAHNFINDMTPLLIANSDQIIESDISHFIKDCLDQNLDGSIMTFPSDDPKWSYVKLENGLVSKVAEKEVISNNATVGIYLYSQGKFFVDACLSMISNAEKSKGEYYIAPTYNYLIASDKKISAYKINSTSMHGLGTPTDLQKYLKLSTSK